MITDENVLEAATSTNNKELVQENEGATTFQDTAIKKDICSNLTCREAFNKVYIVYPKWTVPIDRVKVGYHTGTLHTLRQRYITPYGKGLEMIIFKTEHPELLEKVFFAKFKQNRLCNELFNIDNLEEYKEFLEACKNVGGEELQQELQQLQSYEKSVLGQMLKGHGLDIDGLHTPPKRLEYLKKSCIERRCIDGDAFNHPDTLALQASTKLKRFVFITNLAYKYFELLSEECGIPSIELIGKRIELTRHYSASLRFLSLIRPNDTMLNFRRIFSKGGIYKKLCNVLSNKDCDEANKKKTLTCAMNAILKSCNLQFKSCGRNFIMIQEYI